MFALSLSNVPALSLSNVLHITGVYAQSPSPSTRKATPAPTKIIVEKEPVSGINLSVSPVFLNLITDPGKSISSDFRVKNNGTETEYLQLELMRYTVNASGGLSISDLEANDEFVKWVNFSDTQFSVSPNESKTLKITINPPSQSSLGYYYAIVVRRIKDASIKGGAAIAGAPAIPLLLEVKSKNVKKELQLVDFKTDRPWYEYMPVQFTAKVKNVGNIHTVPVGDVFIDWGSQENIAVLQANEGKGNILPQAEREFTVVWSDGFAVAEPKKDDKGAIMKDKDGKIVYSTNFDFAKANKFRIGKYTAHLLMVYDNGQRDIPLEATVSFWIFPWKIVIAAVVILYFAFIGLKNAFITNIKRLRKFFG
jgi:hypothetical protein